MTPRQKRKTMGRPIELPTARQCSALLTPEQIATAERLGAGNIARGIRAALSGLAHEADGIRAALDAAAPEPTPDSVGTSGHQRTEPP